jgi:hypothetical protein
MSYKYQFDYQFIGYIYLRQSGKLGHNIVVRDWGLLHVASLC